MALTPSEAESKLKTGEAEVCLVGIDRPSLLLSCCLAARGVRVKLVDGSTGILEKFSKGVAQVEHELQKTLKRALSEGILCSERELKEAVKQSSIIVSRASARLSPSGVDYSPLEKFCSEAGLSLQPGSLVILTGVVGLGVTEEVAKPLLEERSGFKAGADFGLAYCPLNWLNEMAFEELSGKPYVIAGIDRGSLEKTEVLFSLAGGKPVRAESLRAAEAFSLFQLARQAVSQALANEFARFCSAAGVSFREICRVAMQAGGFSQPAKLSDTSLSAWLKLLEEEAERLKVEVKLVEAARRIGEDSVRQTVKNVAKLLKERGKRPSKAKIVILGVSSKANLKGEISQAVRHLYTSFKRRGSGVSVWDPLYQREELQSLGFEPATPWEDLPKADCVIVAVGHQIFRKLKPRILSELAARGGGILYDCSGSGIFSHEDSTGKVQVSGLDF